MTPFLHNSCIIHQLSCPHTPEQNGVAEWKHHHIVEKGFTLLAQAFLPLTYWDHAFAIAIYVIKRLPTLVLNNISPMEVLFHVKPDYSTLKVFGCTCFRNLCPYNANNLEFRSIPCTFLGYSPHHKRYMCLAPDGGIYISRHVTFHEHSFAFALIP